MGTHSGGVIVTFCQLSLKDSQSPQAKQHSRQRQPRKLAPLPSRQERVSSFLLLRRSNLALEETLSAMLFPLPHLHPIFQSVLKFFKYFSLGCTKDSC